MTIKVGALEAKNKFSELMEKVAHTGERVVVERRGKPMMALVSIEDLESLESIEGKESIQARVDAFDAWLGNAERIRKMIEVDLAGRKLPSAAELLREAREERDEALP